MPKQILTKKINVFGKGTINTIDAEKISDGAASSSKNFLTYPDKIELIRGRKLTGAEETGSGPVLGLHTVTKIDGTDVTFRKIGTKLQYYNPTTKLWVDCKTGLKDGKKLWFANSNTPAGRQVWACGEDGLFKIYPSNPTSVLDLTDSIKNYKGKILIDKSRMICLPYNDPTGIRFSKVDKDSNYTTISSEAVPTGMVAHYKLNDDAANTTVVDTIGTQNGVASANTSTLTATGKISKCFNLLGSSSQYVSIADNALLKPTVFSISAWVKTLTADGSIFTSFSDQAGVGAQGIYFAIQGGKVCLGVFDAPGAFQNYYFSITSVHDNAWHHITGTYDGVNIKIYVDGILETTGAAIHPPTFHATNYVNIGALKRTGAATEFFTGLIDSVRLYNKALTPTQISLLYNAGSGTEGIAAYSGTLAHAQCFGVVFTKGSQVLTDDKNGNLTGNGSGTINYATGEYSFVFTVIDDAVAATSAYLWENPLVGGLADFTYSASRLAGEGNIQRQDSIGAKSQNVLVFNNTFYTLQDKGSWWVTIDTADTKWDNQVYRLNIGTPTEDASVITADGIVFIDTFDIDNPKLRLLGLDRFNELVIPYDLTTDSNGIGFKMDDYDFTDSVVFKYLDLILVTCKLNSETNNKLIVYNQKLKLFDMVDYSANFFTVRDSKLWAGDSESPNVYEIFSGFDDLEYNIDGEWISKKDNLKIKQLKKFKRFRISGLIAKDQSFDVYAKYDNDIEELLGTISGNGIYVDTSQTYLIGSQLIGEDLIGMGETVEAHYFKTELKIKTPKFYCNNIIFRNKGIGYLAILDYEFADIRVKADKLPKKYSRKI